MRTLQVWWWAWATLLGLVAAGALLVAGQAFVGADLGANLTRRGCDFDAVGGLVALFVAGAAAQLVPAAARLRWDGAVVGREWTALAVGAPLPAALLALSLPGVLGCATGRRVARLELVGDALSGTPGIAIAAACAALLGVAAASVMHVEWAAPSGAHVDDPPDIVELAIAEAEALAHGRAAERFHGVDPDVVD